jgi:hypothetical protein
MPHLPAQHAILKCQLPAVYRYTVGQDNSGNSDIHSRNRSCLIEQLEESGQLQEYLEERSPQARLVYLQCQKAGMSPLQAGETANQDMYSEPEEWGEEDED